MPLLNRSSRGFGKNTNTQATDIEAKHVTTLITQNQTNSWNADASDNKLSLTATGSPRPSKLNPYNPDGYNSVYFNGSTDYLSIPGNAAFGMGTDDYTLEASVYLTAASGSNQMIIDFRNSSPATGQPVVYLNTSRQPIFYLEGSSNLITGASALTIGVWYHIALSKVTGTYTLYINGSSVGTSANSVSVPTSGIKIGADYTSIAGFFIGYISNLRITKGVAVYTGNFTPPTSPLTAITNTSLLTCQSTAIKDNSTNALTITVNGSPSTIPFTFTQNSSYNTYGSAYFASVSDYLQVASNPLFAFPGAFTVEGWFYWPAIPAGGSLLGVMASNGFNFYTDGAYLSFNIYGVGNVCTVAAFPSRNVWHHVAMTRDGSNNCTIWIDGVSSATGTSTQSFVQGIWSIYGGSSNGGSGYVSDHRVVKGTALYTSSFTPPTRSLTAIPTVNVSLQATSFNGTSQYLTVPYSSAFNIPASTAVTFECWVYTSSSTSGVVLVGRNWAYGASGPTWGIDLINGVTPRWTIAGTGEATYVMATSSLSGALGQWNHYALTRDSSNVVNIWVNGVSGVTRTDSQAMTNASGDLYIGAATNLAAGSYFNGSIANMRLVIGQALFTSTFTPSTDLLTSTSVGHTGTGVVASLTGTVSLITCQGSTITDSSPNNFTVTNVGGVSVSTISSTKFSTSLLTLQTNQPSNNHTFFDGSNRNATIVRNGNPFIGSSNPFGDDWSSYFAGADSISHPHIENYNLYNYDAVIDFWINPTQIDTNQRGIVSHHNGTGWMVYISSGKINLETDGSGTGIRLVSTIEVQPGKWTYVKIVKNLELWTIYQDGIIVGSSAHLQSAGNHNQTTPLVVGLHRTAGAANYFIGYISNLRVVRGHSVFDALPATSPIAKFDGSATGVSTPNSTAIDLATGAPNWTIECWFYTTTTGVTQCIVQKDGVSGSRQSQYAIAIQNDNQINVTLSTAVNAGGNQNFVGGSISASTWYHIAVVRSGSNITVFLNGAIIVGPTALSITMGNNTGNLTIGYNTGPADYFTGYISNLRIVKGTALYTSSFEPQRRPLNAKQIPLDTRKNPNRSYSVKFNGTSDYLTLGESATEYALNALDFTVECWVYLNTASTVSDKRIFVNWAGGVNSYQFFIRANNRAIWQLYTDNAPDIAALAITPFVWTHIAWCRRNGFVNTFINGILADSSSVTQSTSGTLTNPLIAGSPADGGNYFPGYISNFRLVKGTALYTSNFIPPTALTADVAGTRLLLCQSSSFIDNSTANAGIGFGVATNGTPSISNKFPYTFGDVVPELSSGTSLLTLQNSTIVDNSVNGLAFTVSGTIPTSNDTPIPLPSITSAASVPSIPGIPSANIVFLSAKSNRIKDSSIYNNSQVTITGSPKVTKFSPFPSTITVPISYSYKFESTSSTVRSKINPTDSVYQWPRLNSWTAEWWMNRTGRSGETVYLLGSPYGSGGAPGIYFQNNSFTISNQGVIDIVTFVAPSSVNFNNNWNHVAVVKSTDTTSINPRYTLFVNGANIGSHVATEYDYGGSFIGIGSDNQPTTGYAGYFSNFRVTRSALYDYTQANVSISKEPLQMTGDTLILTCQSPRLEIKTDYPYLANTGYSTFNGDRLYATENNPFGYITIQNKASYDANAFGGSVYFDGAGDYLAVNEDITQRLSNIFTIQGWFNPTSKIAANIAIVSKGAVGTGWQLMIGTGNTLIFSNATTAIQTTSIIKYNEWNHFAVTRDNWWNTRLFLNGNLETSATLTNPYTETSNIYIGSGRVAGANLFTGYIAGIQIDKHVAYANSFIPPYFAQRPTANTVFYLESIPGIIDSSGRTNFETTGSDMLKSISVNSLIHKNVIFFDGSSALKSAPSSQHTVIAAGSPFTFEANIYPVADNNTHYLLALGPEAANRYNVGLVNGYLTTNKYGAVSSTNVGYPKIQPNVWTNIAVVRTNYPTGVANVVSFYINGVVANTTDVMFSSNNQQGNGLVYIGADGNGANQFKGYMKDIRITNGIARYTANTIIPSKFIPSKTYNSIIPIPSVPKPNVDYLLVAGGGGGGFNAGSGAGAGGVVLGKFQYAPGLSYTITIGGGGTTGTSDPISGTMGGNSSMFGFTVYGGGGGGSGLSNGLFGGSGGGMPSEGPGKTTAAAGVGWPAIPGINQQGFPGAANPSGLSSVNRTTGGGGGAGAIGIAPQVGVGGYGILSSISGANLYYAGGGGGGHHTASGGAGGAGGGGWGGTQDGTNHGRPGFSGNVNTGGGGGGGSGYSGIGGTGGSGIAIISHPTAIATANTTGSNVLVTVDTSNVIYRFYSSGTIQFQ
jgi:Concanavalin A-like lectin/glucanases superfamily